MPRENIRRRVEIMLGEIHRDAGFAETRRDQLELAGINANIPGGEDAGPAGLHHAVDLDLRALDLQAPGFNGTQ